MTEIHKQACPARGCDRTHYRVLASPDGRHLTLEVSAGRHHGEDHSSPVDLRVLYKKLARSRPDIFRVIKLGKCDNEDVDAAL